MWNTFWGGIWQKGVHPPRKPWQKRVKSFLPTATFMFSVKSTPAQTLQRWSCFLGSPKPSRLFLFRFLECIAGEREWYKVGCDQVPLFGMHERVYPAVSTKFGKYPFLARFYPFLARCGFVCLRLGQKHRRLATVPARRCCGTTKRLRPTSKRPSSQTRSNVISIRDHHTTGLGSVISAYHDETWWVQGRVWLPCHALV